MQTILLKPLITEKSTQLVQKGWYSFVVNKKSHKREIAKAVADQFKVHVRGVRTIILKGGLRRVGRKRLLVSDKGLKKALVKLKDKETIPLFVTNESGK